MNERIEKLAKEARLSYVMTTENPYINEDLEKFAALIIKECIESVKQNMYTGHSHSDFSAGADMALGTAVCNIKEKFGVE